MHPSEEGINEDEERLDAAGSDTDDLDETSFTIGLGKTGKGEYHTRNDPSAPYQRQSVIENPGILEIQCKSREIIHGRLSPESDEYATLLVYDIHLDASKRSRRITSAVIKFEFSSSEPGRPGPKVLKIGPLHKWSVSPSAQEEETAFGGELSLGAEFVANVGATASWEKSVSRTTKDEAQVTGSIWSDDFGNPLTAKWRLTENGSTKSGVPSFFRCAILLGRSHGGLFEAKVTIEVDSDWKSKIERLFGSTPRDDPVLFDPEFAPTNKLRKDGYDVNGLENIDLHSEFVAIRFSTTFAAGQKVDG